MMNRFFILMSSALIGLPMFAKVEAGAEAVLSEDVTCNVFTTENNNIYLDNAVILDGFKSNWFVGVAGGTSSLVGSPVGCNDFFGRMKPLLKGYVGKWFTPSVGARTTFDGLQFKDANNGVQDYQSIHLDILWDVLARPYSTINERRWSLIPYVGMGMVHTNKHYHSPASINYGVIAGYGLTERLKLTMELSGTTTSSALDNYPGKHRMADNLIGLSAGLSYTIGKAGWKRVIDAEPYINEFDYLRSSNDNLRRDNDALEEKVFGIKFGPKNDYAGLNSLMARINGQNYDLITDNLLNDGEPFIFPSTDEELNAGVIENFLNSGHITVAPLPEEFDLTKMDEDGFNHQAFEAYVDSIRGTDKCIGAPVFFFFRFNTNNLVDGSQLVNLDKIADVAKKYNCKIRITGSADAATGSKKINKKLSKKRAIYIQNELIKRGCDTKSINVKFAGGISTYPTKASNRAAVVELHF